MNDKMLSYELARQEAENLFDSLNLSYVVSKPIGQVKNDNPKIYYHFIFRDKNGKLFSSDYYMGIGHVNWNKAIRFFPNDSIPQLIVEGKSIAKSYNLEVSQFAAKIAEIQRVYPKAFEVLACCAADGLSALDTFEDWAANFGYDSDSRKAEAIYRQCQEMYSNLKKFIDHETIEKFAELHSQF